MRWFRHYAGAVRDPKIMSVAARTGQPVERVVWTFFAMLESCCEHESDEYRLDTAEAAYLLRCDLADMDSILAGMEAAGLSKDGRVVAWSKRQFQSDKSADRTRRYRERQKRGSDDVTSQRRHGDAVVTPPETETETENKTRRGTPAETALARKFFEAIGITRTPNSQDRQTVHAWLAEGFTEGEILTVTKAKADTLASKRSPLAYAAAIMPDAIAEHRDREAAAERLLDDPERRQWRGRLLSHRETGRWLPDSWGPPPGNPGCRVPADLVAQVLVEARP